MKTPSKTIGKKEVRINELSYSNFISSELFALLDSEMKEVFEVEGLKVKRRCSFDTSPIENVGGLKFVCSIYEEVREELSDILKSRKEDRDFIDKETINCVSKNRDGGFSFQDSHYETVLFKRNEKSK